MLVALDTLAQHSCTESLVACVSVPQQVEELGDWHHEVADVMLLRKPKLLGRVVRAAVGLP